MTEHQQLILYLNVYLLICNQLYVEPYIGTDDGKICLIYSLTSFSFVTVTLLNTILSGNPVVKNVEFLNPALENQEIRAEVSEYQP